VACLSRHAGAGNIDRAVRSPWLGFLVGLRVPSAVGIAGEAIIWEGIR